MCIINFIQHEAVLNVDSVTYSFFLNKIMLRGIKQKRTKKKKVKEVLSSASTGVDSDGIPYRMTETGK